MKDDRTLALIVAVFNDNYTKMFDTWEVMKSLAAKGHKDFTYQEVECYLKHVNDGGLIKQYPNGKYEVSLA